MSQEAYNYNRLKTRAQNLGANLFGVALLEPLFQYFYLSNYNQQQFTYGLSLGALLSPSVLQEIDDKPTLLYKWHYRQANNLLDKIAYQITQIIVQEGFHALPIPASQLIDWKEQKGHVSHRVLAEAAGLGWRGRNNLLVTPQFGAQIRLVSILTDMPMTTDFPMEFGCGSCKACISKCPVKALGDSPENYNFDSCYQCLREYSKIQGIGQMICGICVKACPGKQKKKYGN